MKLAGNLTPRFFHSAVVVEIAESGPVAFVLWGLGRQMFPVSLAQMILIDSQKCEEVI